MGAAQNIRRPYLKAIQLVNIVKLVQKDIPPPISPYGSVTLANTMTKFSVIAIKYCNGSLDEQNLIAG